jgi:Uma2 family endonuclease
VVAALEKQIKRWTYEEYYKLEDDQRYEIIDGHLIMAPAPDTWHQDWLGDLYSLVRSFVKKNKLDAENTVQPDLVFVAAKNLGIIQPRAMFGTPDLVAEVVSPSSARRDRHEKLNLYSRFGVKEYWIGNAANRSLEILTLTNGRYELHCSAEEKGRLSSVVLTGLEFDLADLQG